MRHPKHQFSPVTRGVFEQRYPFSRRDLLKAGAAGLVGLGLPLVAPDRARGAVADIVCNPGGNALATLRVPENIPPGLTLSYPTFDDGRVCVRGTNRTGQTLVLVWNVYFAPNANAFDCSNLANDAFLQGQTLMDIKACVVRDERDFKCCVTVPKGCFQADLGNFQADLGVFSAAECARNPALIGTPVVITSPNLIAALLAGGDCEAPCCIRMTGGGRTGGTIFTPNGVQVTTSQGFQLRTGLGAHSNLEVNFGGTTPGSGVYNFHLGPPDGVSDFRCAFTPCPDGEGGEHPLDEPNTIYGFARGTLNGEVAYVFIKFVDCGEPGTDDRRLIVIWDGTDTTKTPLLFASGTIQNGNNQAHKCNKND